MVAAPSIVSERAPVILAGMSPVRSRQARTAEASRTTADLAAPRAAGGRAAADGIEALRSIPAARRERARLRDLVGRLDRLDQTLAVSSFAALAFVAGLGGPAEGAAVLVAGLGLGGLVARLAGRSLEADAVAAAEREALQDRIWHLAAAVEDWRGLLGASGDIVLAIDADRAIVFANRRFEQTFGLAEPNLRGQPIDTVFARFRAVDPADPGEADPALLLLQTCVGPRRFAVAETGVPDPVAGGPVASVVLTDVTERLEAEAMLRRARDEAEAASAAKSRFLALASHEIRTPLNGIIGMADLLADSPLSPAQANYVRAVHSSGTALLSLVDDVLDLAKVEAGRLDLAEAPVDLGALVEEVVELLAPRAHGKGIELVGRVAPDVPAEVMADAARLRQVLINLVGNAVKFTHSGGVTIEIARRATVVPGSARIALAVRDTGIGVPAADAERIFREFEQVEQGPARRYGGTGLGLAIARQIVDSMGGRIELDSREGVGSTFRFAVDLCLVAEAPPATGDLAGRRIALVSGSPIEAPVLVERLMTLGAAVDVLTPAEAMSPRGPALVCHADGLMIDHAEGCDAGLVLRALSAAGITLPAAVLVAPADRVALDRLRADGFAAHLVKPVRARSLVRVAAALAAGRPIEADPGETDLDETPIRAMGRPLDVLLADDNEINALLGRAMLENLGHRVEVVADGRAAVAAVARRRAEGRPFDAFLTDLHMPGMGGAAAIRAIRAAETEAGARGPRLLAIVQTADATAASRAEATAAGADATLVKPVDSAALAALFETRLARS